MPNTAFLIAISSLTFFSHISLPFFFSILLIAAKQPASELKINPFPKDPARPGGRKRQNARHFFSIFLMHAQWTYWPSLHQWCGPHISCRLCRSCRVPRWFRAARATFHARFVPRYVKIRPDVSRYVKICQDVSRYVKTFQDMTSLKQIRVGIQLEVINLKIIELIHLL